MNRQRKRTKASRRWKESEAMKRVTRSAFNHCERDALQALNGEVAGA